MQNFVSLFYNQENFLNNDFFIGSRPVTYNIKRKDFLTYSPEKIGDWNHVTTVKRLTPGVFVAAVNRELKKPQRSKE